MRKSCRALAACGFIAMATGCASVPRSQATSTGEPMAADVAVATFDSLWSKVSNTYVDTAFVSHEWIAVRDSLRPRAASVTQRQQLDKLLADALRHIPDSHFYLIPARIAAEEPIAGKPDGRGTTGLHVRFAEGRVVAWRVEPGGPAALQGIVPGQEILRIGDKHVDSAIARVRKLPEAGQARALSEMLHGFNGALTPAIGDTAHVWIGGKSEKRSQVSLVAIPGEGKLTKFGNLPPLAALVKTSRVPSGSGTGCAGLIAFNIWLPELGPDLERAVDSVRDCEGVIVDLRGNPGGVGAMVMGFGGYFVSSTRSLGIMKTRQVSLNFVINPRGSRDDGRSVAPFAGPLAIIVDPMTASTSEIFATGMQRIGRARVFGERSAGAALPALMERLPSGDVFVHAVADFTDPAGKRVEGAGVVPDETVPLTVRDLQAGRDAPLEAAIRWIRSTPAAAAGSN